MIKTGKKKLDYSKVIVSTAINLDYNFDDMTFKLLKKVLLCCSIRVDSDTCKKILDAGSNSE